MQNSQNKKTLKVIIFILIAVLTLGIGYASISAINLIISGNATASVNDNNFKVYFVPTGDTPSLTGNVTVSGNARINTNDNTIAEFDVSGLTKIGDYAIATYTILNNSNSIGADISLYLTNSNSEYFRVTETVTDTILQAGDTTTGSIKVELIKTPIDNDVSTSVTGTLKANAIENESATGLVPKSKASDDPESFATDSWATIQTAVRNNNTSAYNVGETKTVTINGTDYTVRLVNKSTVANCNNENYSQTACGFVVEFVDIVDYVNMNTTYTNSGGYPSSLVYTYLRDTLYNQLSSDLRAVIVPTRVISGCENESDSNYETNDKIFILSIKELFDTNISDTAASYTRQLDYYKFNNVSYIGSDLNYEGNHSYFSNSIFVQKNGKQTCDNFTCDAWWARTPIYDVCFVSVSGYGNFVTTGGTSPNKYGVAPAFRIG